MARVLITGGTGYMGRRLIPELAARGHDITAVVRPGSEAKLPGGCRPFLADVLDGSSYAAAARGCDAFVHLVGTPHPAPWKAAQFRAVDRVSGLEAIRVSAAVRNFVYLSVAQPAPVMREYIAVRRECESALRATRRQAHILRPWYVLGPGHRWPYLLLPLYRLAERVPGWRDGALRLGLVTLEQMLGALVWCIEHPAAGIRVHTVEDIRRAGI